MSIQLNGLAKRRNQLDFAKSSFFLTKSAYKNKFSGYMHIFFYYMIKYIFNVQNCMEKMCFRVDFKQNVEFLPSLYTAIDFAVYELGKRSISCLESTQKHNIFFTQFCSVVYKYILSNTVRRNYACAPNIYFYRLIFLCK